MDVIGLSLLGWSWYVGLGGLVGVGGCRCLFSLVGQGVWLWLVHGGGGIDFG